MAQKNKTTLQSYFLTGNIPSQQNYYDLIDSFVNLEETGIQTIKGTISSSEVITGAITASSISSSGAVEASAFTIGGSPVGSSTDTFWNSGSSGKIYYNGGYVGIGNNEPCKSLTVSGSISASLNIYAEDFYVGNEQFTDNTSYTNVFQIGNSGVGSLSLTNVTASGAISASGILSASAGYFANNIQVKSTITASGNISSSGGHVTAKYYDAATVATGFRLGGSNVVYFKSNAGGVAAYTFGRQNQPTLVSGSTIELGRESTTHVTASGNISASGDLLVNNITASGNISASGTIYANNFESAGSNVDGISFVDDLYLSGSLTASGNISSSGTISALSGSFSNLNVSAFGAINVSNITSSGIISSSSPVYSNIFYFNAANTSYISASDAQADLVLEAQDDIFVRADDIFIKNRSNINYATFNGERSELTIKGNITASGTISSSGNLITNGITAIGNVDASTGIGSFLSLNSATTITASGDVSSSGAVYGVDFYNNNKNLDEIYSKVEGNTSLTTVGALDTGSITSGFTSIDVGAGSITTTGILKGGNITGSIISASGDIFANSASFGEISSSGTGSFDGGLVLRNHVAMGTNNIKFGDTGAIWMGDANDFQLHHNNDNSMISVTNGDLTIRTKDDDRDILIQSDNGSGGLATYILIDGSEGNVAISTDIIAQGLVTASSVAASTHITASGNISASGTITANAFSGTLTGTSTGLTGTPDIVVGAITATSINTTNITSSIVTASVIYSSGSNIFGDESTDTHTFNGNITASGNISASGTGSFGRIEVLHISSSTGTFDANTVKIGGESFSKSDLETLKQGKAIITTANRKSLGGIGDAEAVTDSSNYIRPEIIMHPTDDESAIINKTAGRLQYRSPGGDPFEVYADGDVELASRNDYIRLGSNTTTNSTAGTNSSKGTAVRIPGHISASNKTAEHTIGGVTAFKGNVRVTGSLEVSGSSTFTNWGNFRNRFHQGKHYFQVTTNPYAVGGFRDHLTPPATNALTGSAPHLHFALSGSGQTGIGTLSPQHTLHVSESSANFKALQVEGTTQFNGFVSGLGMGNSVTISSHVTVPGGHNVMLWTSTTNPSITVNSGINYTVQSGGDVTIRSVNF